LEPPLLAAKAVKVGTHFAFGAKASCIDIGVYALNIHVHIHPCQDLRKEQFQLRPCPDQKIAIASPSDRLALEHEELARGDLLCPGFSNSR
jgi:hypothetical protein